MIKVDTTTFARAVTKYVNGRRAYSEKVLRATVSDLRSRAPGWIAQEVVQVYNLKKTELTPSKKGKAAGGITVKGDTIDTLAIRYTGRKLTPLHFKMKPTTRPVSKKKKRNYVVSAEVLKGQRKDIKGAFLGRNPQAKGQTLPWQHVDKTSRKIKPVKTVSIPEMVYTRRTAAAIDKKLNEGIKSRLEHNAKRFKG